LNSLVVQNFYIWQFYILKTQRNKFLKNLFVVDITFLYFKYYTISLYSSKYLGFFNTITSRLFSIFILKYRYYFLTKYIYRNISMVNLNLPKSYTYWSLKLYINYLYDILTYQKHNYYLKHKKTLIYSYPIQILLFSFNKKHLNTLVLYFFHFFFTNYFSYSSEFKLTYSYFYKWNLLNIFVYNYLYYFKVKHF